MRSDGEAWKPNEAAWALVNDYLRVTQEYGSVRQFPVTQPDDPADRGRLAFCLAQIAAFAIMSGGDDGDDLDADEPWNWDGINRFAAMVREMTDSTGDPKAGPDAEQVRVEGHYGPDGPVNAVFEFLEHVVARSADGWWRLLDDDFRLARVQAWLWNNRTALNLAEHDLDTHAAALAAPEATAALWADFALTELRQLRENWEPHLARFQEGTLGAGSASRVVGPDTELVVLVPIDDGRPALYTEPTLVSDVLVFTVRRTTDAWRIAAYGDQLPSLGWPPSF